MRTFLRGKVTLLFMMLGLLLAVPAVALADIIVSPDADTVTPGNQGSSSAFPIDLGSVKGGGTLTKQVVSFQLRCSGNNHVDSGQTVTVNFASHNLSSGSVTATNATIGPIPTTWPDDVTGGGSTNCPTPAPTPIEDNGNSTVTVTAPTTEGTYNFSAIWNNNNMTPSGSDDSSDVTGTTEVFFRFTVDTTAPTVTDVSPSDGATDVPKGSNVEATFSEAMDAITTDGDPSTINGSTFTLTKPDGNDAGTDPDPVAGAVSYDSATKKATLDPTADLDYSTTYTATVTTGAEDVVGNALDQDGAAGTQNAKTWTFTTEPPPNVAPNDPGAPGLATGSSSPNQGGFTLTWTEATPTDADGNFDHYVLQHKDTNDSGFTDVTGATNLSSNSYTFGGSATEAEGTWTYQVKAVDTLGAESNYVTSTTGLVKVDKSNPYDPTFSVGTPDYDQTGTANDWYKDSATVQFSKSTTTTNGDRDLADGSAGSGFDHFSTTPANTNGAITLNTAGANAFSGRAVDVVGRQSDPAVTGSVNVDTQDPTVSFTDCPTGSVVQGSDVTVHWTASDPGASANPATGSGLTSSSPTSGSVKLDTSAINSHTASVAAGTVQDNVGQTSAEATCTYDVDYNWTGFFSPVDNLPTLNVVKGGSSVPMKFNLGGNQGMGILAAGYPKSISIPCDSTAELDALETVATAGSSGLNFDATTNQYNYIWKTDKAWTSGCRQVEVKLIDGTSHRANFKFTK